MSIVGRIGCVLYKYCWPNRQHLPILDNARMLVGVVVRYDSFGDVTASEWIRKVLALVLLRCCVRYIKLPGHAFRSSHES